MYAAGAVSVGTAVARRVHLDPEHRSGHRTGFEEATVFEGTWRRIRSLGVPGALGALVAREALVFLRVRRLRFICAVAVVFVLFYAFHVDDMSALLLTTLVCFPLLTLSAIFNNTFAFDRGGALGYGHLPLPLHHVFLAKNVVAGTVTTLLTVMAALPVAVVLGFRVMPAIVPFALFFWYLLFGLLACGNLISVLYPKAIDPQSVFGWLNPVASLPVVVVATAALLAPPWIVFSGGNASDLATFMAAGVLVTAAAWLGSLFGAAALLRKRGLFMEQRS
jgi:hypothetical protein